VASFPGLGTDSARVTVLPASVDTVLFEDWAQGIRPTRWEIVGTPRPAAVRGAGLGGGSAFISNGDYNWPSGVLTRSEFQLGEGVTLELDARFEFTGQHWQELELALVPRAVAFNGSERAIGGRTAWWWVTGPSPKYQTSTFGCGTDGDGGALADAWPPGDSSTAWHRLVLEIRPDRRGECYLDGKLLGRFGISEDAARTPVAVYVGGRTYKTRIYHGLLLLTRGLRY
jgi:hypothetical protein